MWIRLGQSGKREPPRPPFVLVLVLEHVFKTPAAAPDLRTTGRCITHVPFTNNQNHPIASPSPPRPIGSGEGRSLSPEGTGKGGRRPDEGRRDENKLCGKGLKTKIPTKTRTASAPIPLSANGIGRENFSKANFAHRAIEPKKYKSDRLSVAPYLRLLERAESPRCYRPGWSEPRERRPGHAVPKVFTAL